MPIALKPLKKYIICDHKVLLHQNRAAWLGCYEKHKYDMTWHDMTRHDTTRHNTIQHDTTQDNTTQDNITKYLFSWLVTEATQPRKGL